MRNNCIHQLDNSVMDKPELSNLKVLYGLDMFLLVTDFLMPQYFGIDVGFDITCTRFANILIIIYVIINSQIFRVFSRNCLKISVSIPLFLYLTVALYTMILRVDINAFMVVFLEILTFYMLLFGIRYVIGIKKSFKVIIFCAYFLSIYGLVEFVAGESLYLKFLKTVPSAVANVYRSGSYRIMGPCGHPLGYGLLLLLLVPLACIDLENDELYLFKRPFLVFLLFVNVFLTGSRSTLAISFLELVLIVICTKKNRRKKSLAILIIVFCAFVSFTFIFQDTKLGQYIMRQITSVVDLVLHTQLSAKYGAEVERLEDSEGYREFLPKIFTLDWLNPLVGRGVKRSVSVEFVTEDGVSVYINSIDNFYVLQYIKYAYPGLISYVGFILVSIVEMLKKVFKYKSGIINGLVMGFACYFFNLWYLDALQTLKFVYVVIAMFFAYISALSSLEKEEEKNCESKCDCSCL